jgi:serine phosphatase RsbU (regulator of sigma subunit)
MDDDSRLALGTDLELAAAVQGALLNGEIPDCQCGKMVLRYRMSVQVGGDFYHFCQLGQDQVAFAIGDVVGHGMGSALIMSLIMGTLRSNVQDSRRPSRMVEQINDLLVNLGEQVEHYITCSMIYGVVDLPSGVLLYVNAGHPYPIIYNRIEESCQELGSTTMLLGVQQGVQPESCHQFRQNDRVVLYTDGITDASNANEEPFSDNRLKQIVCSSRQASPDALARRVFEEMDTYSGKEQSDDDQTLVVIDFDLVTGGI